MIARIGKDFLCFAPPLTTPEDDLRRMIDIAADSLRTLAAG
jgi:hypothetical protein